MDPPSEIIVHILGYLTASDVARFCLTNKSPRLFFNEQLFLLFRKMINKSRIIKYISNTNQAIINLQGWKQISLTTIFYMMDNQFLKRIKEVISHKLDGRNQNYKKLIWLLFKDVYCIQYIGIISLRSDFDQINFTSG